MEKLPQSEKRIVALDIGGTLAKVAFTLPSGDPNELVGEGYEKQPYAYSKLEAEGLPTIHLRKYKTASIDTIIEFIKANGLLGTNLTICATGGGSYKYEELLKSQLNASIKKVDEMKTVQLGLSFVLEHIKQSVFTYEGSCNYLQGGLKELLPFLIVNVGSGVSIIKVSGPLSYERVSGSMIGGGTLMGLANMLLGISDFEELLKLSEGGDNAKVDMMVRDLYAQTTSPYGLQADVISSSFGKAASGIAIKRRKSFFDSPSKVIIDQHQEFTDADIAKSLVSMIAANIAHLSYLCARIHKINRIMFTGNYIRNYPVNMEEITKAVGIWSHGDITCLFLRYDGYLGAIGCALEALKEDANKEEEDKAKTA